MRLWRVVSWPRSESILRRCFGCNESRPPKSRPRVMSQSAAIEAFTAALRDMDKLDALTALEPAINAIDAESEADITLELNAAIDAPGAAYVRSDERRVGKVGVSKCRSRGSPRQ